MGVHGLWRLIEPSGKPVPLETLENKILAVDISIWLHQAVKGFQDARGAPLPNAHLLGIYHRLCKLLYFRIKPVFIFDGGVPVLKKQTIAKRNQQSTKIRSNANSIQQKILSTLLRHSAIQKIISEETDTPTPISKNVFSKNPKPDMFHLPSPEPNPEMDTTVDSDSSESSEYSPTKQQWDLHTIDEKSQSFKSLPAEVRHDILTDLKEQRKQSSWGKIHELPKQSGDFSSFQMKRLLKRYSVQVTLEEVTQEMGGHTLSLNELETLLTEQGIVTASKTSTRRIASNENKSYLLIKDVKKAIEEAKSEEQKLQKQTSNEKLYEIEIAEPDSTTGSKDSKESEYERDLKAAIQLSLMETPSTSKDTSGNYDYLENFNDGDFDSDSSGDVHEVPKSDISAAQRYMLEYSDLTPYEIEKIINDNKNKNSNKKSKTNLAEIKLPKITEENIDSLSKSEEIIIIDSSDNLNDSIKGKNESECVLIKAANNDDNFKSKYPSAIQTHLSLGETETKLKIDFDSSSKIDICQNTDTHSDYNQKTNLNKVDSTEFKTELDANVTETKNTEPMSDSEDDFVEVEEVADKTVAVITEYKGTISSDIETKKLDNVTKSMDESLIEIKESIDINIEPLKPEINEVINESKSEEVMSDSDESDFIEVEEQTSKSVCSKQFEVVINPSSKIEDDIFDDIFNTSNTSNKEQPVIEKIEISVKPSDITQKKESIITDVNKIVNENKPLESSEIKLVTNESVKNKNSVTQEKNKTIQNKPKLTLQELNKLQSELAKEQEELVTERNIKERMASDITGQMYQEAQELLELFGVPYLVAPMEAEAQCAFLNIVNLTDGTITDDSDIWLFGGQTVYKNFFNQRKHVMEYRAERIQQYFKLTRQQMILLALLVGSDYTLGIPGIGPVTALEILAAFPPAKNIEINFLSENELIAGLLEFKHWLTDGRSYGPGRTTLRSKLQNIQMSEGFPNLQVVKAYLQPEIESSRDKFSWAKPDFVGLVDYAREKFGWTRLKTEEILKPVVKKLEDTGKQKSIKDYFATKHKVEVDLLAEAKISKRVKTAINRMGKSPEQLKAEPEKKVPEKGRKKVNLKNLTKEKNKKFEKRGKIQSKEETCNQDTLNLEKELMETNIVVTQKSEDVIAQEMEKFIEKTVPERGFRRKVNLKNLMKAEPKKGRRSYSKDKTILSEKDKSEIIRRRQKREEEEIEKIPQREQDKIMSLKAKLKAIEVYRKTKIDKKCEKHNKKGVKLREEAKLSESSDSS